MVAVRATPEEVTETALNSAAVLEESAPFDSLAKFADETAVLLKKAKRYEFNGKNGEAAGIYLKVAADAHVRLLDRRVTSGSEEEKALLGIYNSALGSLASRWIEDPRRVEADSCVYVCGGESWELSLAPGSPYGSEYFDHMVPSDSLHKRGIVKKTREGGGASLVAIREQRPGRGDEMRFFPGRGVHVPVTLTIDAVITSPEEGGRRKVIVSLRNPLVEERIQFGDRWVPLAADFSAPLAVVMRGGNEVISGMHGFLRADERIVHSGLLLLEPYDPNRVPVIFIHGLFSVPMIWRDLIPEMVSDPEIAEHYQFMLFTYPSSFPIIESAKLLRDEIAALRAVYDPGGLDPLSCDVVVVGHSMGGVLARSLVTEFGDNLWKQYSDVPLDEIHASDREKETIRQLVYFKPDPGVTRAIFYSTPHRGSEKARQGLARIISRSAQLPENVVQFTSNYLDPGVRPSVEVSPDEKTTSVESLQPGSQLLSAMEMSPYKKGVRYHSIMGDRGRGDTPKSSDGIVEYWSARQEGAASELIVPSDHKTYRHPEGVSELRRILREHAQH